MALQEKYNKPDFANAVDDDVDDIRERFQWVAAALVANGIVLLPNWTGTAYSNSSPEDLSQPDYWLLTSDGDNRELRIDLTWTSDKITGVVLKYNDGVSSPGMTTVTGGTFTITYDGNNNVTGYTTA